MSRGTVGDTLFAVAEWVTWGAPGCGAKRIKLARSTPRIATIWRSAAGIGSSTRAGGRLMKPADSPASSRSNGNNSWTDRDSAGIRGRLSGLVVADRIVQSQAPLASFPRCAEVYA